jgi:hypothetical protein
MVNHKDIIKEIWSKPDLMVLDFKETRGGNNPDTVEDDYLDAFNELSP